MDFWDFLGSRHEQLLADALQHASAVFQCMVAATLIGVLIGVVTYRSEWAGNLATLSTSTGRSRSDPRGPASLPGSAHRKSA